MKGELKKLRNIKDSKKTSIRKDSTALSLNADSRKLLNNFIDLAKEYNIEVLLVYAPDIRVRSWNYFFFDELEGFAQNKGVGFLNLNDYYSEISLDLQGFRDPSHLNISGSIKTTRFLADYLNENYRFSNRGQTENYQESMDLFEEFKILYSPIEPAILHEQME